MASQHLKVNTFDRVERLQSAITHGLDAISDGRPLAAVLDVITRGVERVVPGAVASVLLVDVDGRHLWHGAAPSLPQAYNDAIDGMVAGSSAGSCGTATYRRETVIVTDIARDPLWADFRDLALGHGLRACWSTPVLDASGAVLATYAIYHREPRTPTDEDLDLLRRMGHLVQFAVERDRQVNQLRASEERFRLLSQATNDAIWDWDIVRNTLWWSDGFETLFGFRRDEVEPSLDSWTSRVHPDDVDPMMHEIQQAIEHRRADWSGDYRFRRQDGTYAQIHDRGHIIYDAAGRAVRMVGGMNDVTRRLALEEQLRQSQQLESLGQLTGGVAHDFNNLLTVILGNADLLLEDLPPGSPHHLLVEMISGAAQRGADLTRRLLAFARRQSLDPKVVDLNHLVSGMDGLLRRTLGEHIEIEMVRSAGAWRVLIDPAQLDSALLNLCLNARDAMPNGGRLTIETGNIRLDDEYAAQHVDVTPGQYVMLAVSDTGSGIAPEHLARVFEPFFTTKELGKGTGLGLAMVFGFIKQSGGHINIYSEVGQGTTVRLYLPRLTTTQVATPATAPDETTAAGGETILLVEDEPMVRRYARDLLTSLGYHVLEASNGPQALAILHAHPDIALLFTDMVMPGGMSGRDLAGAAREDRPGLPVLFASGYTESALLHHGRLEPGVHLLTKPFRRADLAQKVRDALA